MRYMRLLALLVISFTNWKFSLSQKQAIDVFRLERDDLIEWKGKISPRRSPALLYIKAPYLIYPKKYYTMLKLQIQGARFRIQTQTGNASNKKQKGGANICEMGKKLIAPRKAFHIIIRVKDDGFMVYYNQQVKIIQLLLPEAPNIHHISNLRVYGSAKTRVFRILYPPQLTQQLQHSSCGTIRRQISVPSYCPSTKAQHPNAACRIVGGDVADPAKNPWQVAIRKKAPFAGSNSHVCGGTLIDQRWVLTAAHCFLSTSSSSLGRLAVRVGDYYNRDGEEHSNDDYTERSEDINVEDVFIHEAYQSYPAARNDVALVKLSTQATLSDFVQPACLPSSDDQFPAGERCGVSGWGAANHTQYVGDYPACLQSAMVEIYHNIKCKTAYKAEFDKDIMMCAGSECTDTCQGDSGGPLICNRNGNHVLWGITSWGIGCGDISKPGVYTRLSKFLKWIYITMKLSPKDEAISDLIRANTNFCSLA